MIPRGRQTGRTFHWRGIRCPESERTTRTFEPISEEAKARFRQVLAEREARVAKEAPAVMKRPATEDTMAYSYADILTEEVVKGWHEEYLDGRSMEDIARNNGLVDVTGFTVRRYFIKFGLPVGRKAIRLEAAQSVKTESSLLPASKNGQAKSTELVTTELAPIFERVRKAQEQLEELKEAGELEVKSVTLNFDLTISV